MIRELSPFRSSLGMLLCAMHHQLRTGLPYPLVQWHSSVTFEGTRSRFAARRHMKQVNAELTPHLITRGTCIRMWKPTLGKAVCCPATVVSKPNKKIYSAKESKLSKFFSKVQIRQSQRKTGYMLVCLNKHMIKQTWFASSEFCCFTVNIRGKQRFHFEFML